MDSGTLLNLRKFLAPEIVYGKGALSLAGRHAQNFGATRVLVVTDSGVQEAGWASKVENSLMDAGLSYTVFNSVTPNPKDHEVMAGAELCKAEQCDLIVAVGGGSPMDCAKGIGISVGNPGHITKFEGVDEVAAPGPPLIFIPTTAGSSADVSQFAIVTDTSKNVKRAIISKMVIPDIALIDPETTITMPPDLTAATGMDALCHAFEAFVSNLSSPLTDMAALSSAQLVKDNLLLAFENPEDLKSRDNMMMASLMAGLAFSNASLGLVHAMAHSLGGGFDLAHGECNAMLLEKVVRYNYSAAFEKYDRLAAGVGLTPPRCEPGESVDALVDWLATLRSDLGITGRLGDMGVAASDINDLAGHAMQDPCFATNPRGASREDVLEIYTEIL